jgi:ubiquinone/menaquinone biosynthesis C-methylase UbiE
VSSQAEQSDDVFDRPTAWRDQAVDALGLVGEQVMAATSPGASFPTALRSIAAAIPDHIATIADLGAGAGGASEWLRSNTGAHVIAVEPAAVARRVAARRFPRLDVRDGSADASSLDDASVDVVLFAGVLSLIDDLGPVLDEVDRILTRPGWVAVTDLFSADDADVVTAPNTFRSFEALTAALTDRGLRVVGLACGSTEPDSAWQDTADAVTRWIRANRSDDAAFEAWLDDQEHLRRHIQAGSLLGGCLVAKREDA